MKGIALKYTLLIDGSIHIKLAAIGQETNVFREIVFTYLFLIFPQIFQ